MPEVRWPDKSKVEFLAHCVDHGETPHVSSSGGKPKCLACSPPPPERRDGGSETWLGIAMDSLGLGRSG